MEPYEQKTPGERGNGIMRTEAGAPSPIWLEQAAAEELAGVCMEILGNARNELYLSMRFLDVALSSLYFAPDPSVRGLGTDGTTLFFQMESLAAMYKKNRILVNRTYLHGVLHCLFCHLWNRKKRDREYWDLACDIAAESVIDSLLRPCVRIPPSAARREFYMRLESRCGERVPDAPGHGPFQTGAPAAGGGILCRRPPVLGAGAEASASQYGQKPERGLGSEAGKDAGGDGGVF